MKDTTPFSDYALFFFALKGYKVTDAFKKEIPKFILWEIVRGSDSDIEAVKKRSHSLFHFVKK